MYASEVFLSMSEVKLHLGDCLEFMRGMADKSVDAVITDRLQSYLEGDTIGVWIN